MHTPKSSYTCANTFYIVYEANGAKICWVSFEQRLSEASFLQEDSLLIHTVK